MAEKDDDCGWTVDTLREHVREILAGMMRERDDRDRLLVQIMDERQAAGYRQFDTLIASIKEQMDKQIASTDRRFEAANEFRGQLSDQAATFLTRKEYEAAHTALEKRVDDIRDMVNRTHGERQGVRMTGSMLVAGVSALSAVVVIVNLIVAAIQR